MKNNILKGVIFILIGAFFIYWAQSHSPEKGLVEKIGNELSGSYTLTETWFYITLAIGAFFAVFGIVKIIRK